MSILPEIKIDIVRGVCNFLSSVSSQQIFEVRDVKALSVSQLLDRLSQLWDRSVLQLLDRLVLQLRVTAHFYLKNKGKYILEAWGYTDPKDTKRREREKDRERPLALWLFFLCFFLLPLSLPYVNCASQECYLFYLMSSLQTSDLPLLYFHGLFPSLSFSHRHSGLLFPILTT